MDYSIELGRQDVVPDDGETREDPTRSLAPDVSCQKLAIVNVCYIGTPSGPDREWVLLDTGIPGRANAIRKTAEKRFGKGTRPAAIVLTHGHFDHVGSLENLVHEWDVPVVAHRLEWPYLDGSASYPPPDPKVGGGMMAAMSRLMPRKPVNVGPWLAPLADDGTIDVLPGWRWIHTPGHTPGHVSLWRETDRLLLSGDACVTTQQESVYAVLTQKPALHGPPMYYTQDWEAARASVERLAELEPQTLASGHGTPLRGAVMRRALHELARDFDRIAKPAQGRYVNRPARPGRGAYPPPRG